jgi:branched-chain amino acid transport system substrate-binding protein
MKNFKKGLIVACTCVAISTQADVVKVGINAPFTGTQQGVGNEVKGFWEAFAKHATKKQLLKNHQLKIVALDDEFDPKKTSANAQKLIEQGVAVITGTAGVPHVLAMTNLLESANVPLLAPNGGTAEIRGKSAAVFHIKPSFVVEVDRAADVLGSLGADKFVVITDDAPGRQALADQFAKRVAIKNVNAVLLKTIVVLQKGGDVAAAIKEATATKPSGIFLMVIPGMVPGIIKAMKDTGYSGLTATWSIAATDQVVTAAKEAGRSVIFTSIVPVPAVGRFELSRKFILFCEETGVKPSFRGMEAYISGLVLVNALNRIPGRVSGGALWSALENTRKLDLGGLLISFSPDDRDGSDFVDIVILGRDGKFKY